MGFKRTIFIICVVASLGGCASVSSSSAPKVVASAQTVGPVFITKANLPPGMKYEVIGPVKANARAGYGSVESLYPMLAEEARKIGANAVVDVYGGRTVSAFSWAAPFAGGNAVKVEDADSLKALEGQFFQ